MQSHKDKNRIIVASAGSLKTTSIVREALAITGKRVLLTTYTNDNVDQIISYIVKQAGRVPQNLTVTPWFTFLLQDGVRPYQNHMTDARRVKTIDFVSKPNRYSRKADIDKYYLTQAVDIYGDKVSEFVVHCDNHSNGLPIRRLERIYGAIFVDELQDFAGYDLTLLEKLLASSIRVVAVGDPRQGTFSTNKSQKNKQFKRSGIIEWITQGKDKGLFSVEEKVECHRSNQLICDFADALFPSLPKTTSMNKANTGHDGVFCIKNHEVLQYVETHNPKVLRHDKRAMTMNLAAVNIGLTKGQGYDRVLIFPTQPMKNYMATKDLSKAGDLSKLYVAVTRARHSVAFVL